MYKHHEESIQKMIDYFSSREEIIAVILGGSIAKGLEHEKSDLDAILIVTDENYEERKKNNLIAECIWGYCTYPEGYFDCKYYKKDILKLTAQQGSEPARNAYIGAKVLFSKDPEIADLAARIPVFQEAEYEEKMLSFYSALMLNYNYFWQVLRPDDDYMKVKTASEIIYHIYRMILQENKILFPCNRNLERTLEKAQNKPENILKLGKKFAQDLSNDSCIQFVNAFLDWSQYCAPEGECITQDRYVKDYELWWMEPRPLVNEW